MGWRIKTERPEERYLGEAQKYYSQEGRRYEKNAIRHIQENILLRGLAYVDFAPGARILDVGCGTGLGMLTLKKLGYDVFGIDVSKELLVHAKKRRLAAELGDMRKIPHPDNSFDGIVSISALQWISSRPSFAAKSDLRRTAFEFFRVVKKGGAGLVQFYPKSESEMMQAAASFHAAGFKTTIQIEGEGNPRKRRIYLILKK